MTRFHILILLLSQHSFGILCAFNLYVLTIPCQTLYTWGLLPFIDTEDESGAPIFP